MSNNVTPMFIDGEDICGMQRRVIRNPYNSEIVAEVCISSITDADHALEVAHEAVAKAASLSQNQKAEILEAASQVLKTKKEEFAQAITVETGKPLKNTRVEVQRGIETLLLSATAARSLKGEMVPIGGVSSGEGCLAYTVRVPAGVIVAITPFNAPLNLVLHKLGPAIAAGNSIVLKPSEQGSNVAVLLAKLFVTCGYPAGALNVVQGGADIGSHLVADQRVRLVSFTGGVSAAVSITKLAGIKRVLFELGGNAATIVHHDANIKEAAKVCVGGAYSNSGQTCVSVQRVYIHKSKFDKFVNHFVSETNKLILGDPLEENTDIGTMISTQAAKRVESWVHEAVEQGAEIVYGGVRKDATMQPTVLINVSEDMKVVCEEIFGPVAVLLPYQELDEVIQRVNDSPFGLQAGLFTESMTVALDASRRLDVGGVIINGPSTFRADSMPYGGVKNSGIGREGPLYAINEMTEERLVVFK